MLGCIGINNLDTKLTKIDGHFKELFYDWQNVMCERVRLFIEM